MRLYPAIDIKDGQCVRLKKGLFNDVTVYPSRYFTAYNGVTGRTEIAKDTCCIHHFGASWLSPTRRFKDKIKTLINRII